MALPDKRKLYFLLAVIFMLGLVSFFLLMCFLAKDVFNLPYLTPLAHFLGTVISPLLPPLAALTLGAFLKVCQHETFPGKKKWIFMTGIWCWNHEQRVWKKLAGLYLGKNDDGEMVVCGLKACRGSWVQVALLGIVVVGQVMGWRWDAGFVDGWVEGIVEWETKLEEEKKAKAEGMDVEKAIVDADTEELVDEKEVVGGDIEESGLLIVVEEKEVVSGDIEKSDLLIEVEAEKEVINVNVEESSLLIEVEEKQVEKD
jgi:hypothetical protein